MQKIENIDRVMQDYMRLSTVFQFWITFNKMSNVQGFFSDYLPNVRLRLFLNIKLTKIIFTTIYIVYYFHCEALFQRLVERLRNLYLIVKTQRNSTQRNSKATSVGVRHSSQVFHLPTHPTTHYHKLFSHFQTSQRAEIWHRHSLDQSN